MAKNNVSGCGFSKKVFAFVRIQKSSMNLDGILKFSEPREPFGSLARIFSRIIFIFSFFTKHSAIAFSSASEHYMRNWERWRSGDSERRGDVSRG
jgi:hypothetical protein